MPSFNFLPLAAAPPFLAQDKKVAHLASSAALRSEDGCSADRLRPVDRHRDRDGRGSENHRARRTTMANIRTFTRNETGAFIREIVTPSFQAKNGRLVPETNRANENAPTHPAFLGRAQIGAARPKPAPQP